MSTAVTLFFLRETNHLLAALTRKAAESGVMDEAELQSVIPDRLVLRNLPETKLKAEGGTPTGRATFDFKIDLRHIAVAAAETDRVDEAVYLSRPTEFSLIDDVPTKTPPALEGVTRLSIDVKAAGVTATVYPDSVTMISKEIPVWCLIHTDDRTLVQTAKIPKNPNVHAESGITLPFPVVPAGTHNFLIMIAGFQPIWDQLGVNGKRTWKRENPGP